MSERHRDSAARLCSPSYSTFSDASLGPMGIGFACVVSVEGSEATRRSGIIHGVSQVRDGELMSIAKALELVPCGATVTVNSDLIDIGSIMEKLDTPAAVLISWVVQERLISATFRYMGSRHNRPCLYRQCHRASRRAAQGRPMGKGWA